MAISAVILGSYRKHFSEVQHAKSIFEAAGWHVPVPRGDTVDETALFVRLTGDKPGAEPAELEDLVIADALAADIVYFVIPDGYIGRTTSYELGRLIGSERQLFFSHLPDDLPVRVDASRIVTPEQLVDKLSHV